MQTNLRKIFAGGRAVWDGPGWFDWVAESTSHAATPFRPILSTHQLLVTCRNRAKYIQKRKKKMTEPIAPIERTTQAPTKTENTALPRITITYCTQCKWMLRAAYVCLKTPILRENS